MSDPLVTKPISAQMQAEIDKAVASVPAGKRGRLNVGLSNTGTSLTVGYKPTSWFGLGGYAGKLWGGGWNAGAAGQVTW